MRSSFHITSLGLAALAAASLATAAFAAKLSVTPDGCDLQAIIDHAADGDEVRLAAGTYRGPLQIKHPMTITGDPGAVVAGSGQGSVVTVSAPGAVVRGLDVRGSGRSLEKMDSGIFVEQTAHGAIVENNRIEGNLFGVYLHGSVDAIVRHNSIIGLHLSGGGDTGNGVSVWNAPGAKVIDNDFRFGRDGIFAITSRNNEFRGNRFSDLRFAIHYMYTNDGEISDNVSKGNLIGYALMFSKRLIVRNNVSDHDRDRGILFNGTDGSQITGNTVIGGCSQRRAG